MFIFLLDVTSVKSKHLGIVAAGLFTGWMPFLISNHQHQSF